MSEPLDIPGLMPYPSVPLKFMPVDDVWSEEYRRVWLLITSGAAQGQDLGDLATTGARMLGTILGCLEAIKISAGQVSLETVGRMVIERMVRFANDLASDAADEAARVALSKLESEDAE